MTRPASPLSLLFPFLLIKPPKAPRQNEVGIVWVVGTQRGSIRPPQHIVRDLVEETSKLGNRAGQHTAGFAYMHTDPGERSVIKQTTYHSWRQIYSGCRFRANWRWVQREFLRVPIFTGIRRHGSACSLGKWRRHGHSCNTCNEWRKGRRDIWDSDA